MGGKEALMGAMAAQKSAAGSAQAPQSGTPESPDKGFELKPGGRSGRAGSAQKNPMPPASPSLDPETE